VQYHQVRMLCSLKDGILKLNPGMPTDDAMAVAKERMNLLGSGSAILFDLNVEKNPGPHSRGE
jgi:hypothetical protein